MYNWYDTIKQYFGLGLYTADQVAVFVAAGWITTEQAEEITGQNAAA